MTEKGTKPRDAGDVDDGSVRFGLQVREEAEGEVHGTADVDVDLLVCFFQGSPCL